MKSEPIILKLGGSVVTVKEKPLTPNLQAIERLTDEIALANIAPLIIIHGGGSFGHPIASTYKIAEGFTNQTQLIGFSKTHESMVALNNIIMHNLFKHELPALSMAPSAFIVTKKGRIHIFQDEPLRKALYSGLIPVLYGDPVLDIDKIFTILSGDQVASFLAVKFKAKKLVICVDVDGIYDSDPKTDPKAHLITHITIAELQRLKYRIGGSGATDVTGGMLGKVSELITPVVKGVSTLIVNGLKSGIILKALKGEDVIGTWITA